MRISLGLLPAAALFVVGVNAGPAAAQAPRTFVSGTGSDSNPCSVSLPCRTFQKAHDSTAANGEVVALTSAGYGTLTITKGITISATGVEAAITTTTGQTAITVNAATSEIVALRGLTLIGGQAGDSGVSIANAQAVLVQNCSIAGFTNSGILAGGSLAGLVVADSTLIFNGEGINFAPTGGSSVANAELINTRVDGGFVGVALDSSQGAAITASLTGGSASNNAIGVLVRSPSPPASGPPVTAILRGVEAVGNIASGVAAEGAAAVMYLNRTKVYGNATGLMTSDGGTLVSFGNNAVSGNGTDGAPTTTISLK